MYPASFPGLGRGLDFLLPSFLVSRQEKKVEARWIRPTEYHFNDDECAKRDTFSGYKDLIIWKRITFLGYSFHVTGKRVDFFGFHVGAYRIRPTGRHPKDDECAKRDTFSRYNDLIIWKRITFLGYSFHRWNVLGAYAIRPYRVTGKHIDFLRSNVGEYCIRLTGRHPKDGKCAKRGTFSGYKDLIIWKRITFFIFIMYPAIFLGLGRGLDFLLPSFLVSRQEKKVEARWIRSTEYHFNDDESQKCDTFSGYKDLIIWKRITFWVFIFDEW